MNRNNPKGGIRTRSNPLLRLRKRIQASAAEYDQTELFLAKLFHRIAYTHGLADRVVGPGGEESLRYSRLLDEYVARLVNNPNRRRRKRKVDSAKRDSIRGNIQKQLTTPTMTWNVFCSGMRLLKIDKMVFHIETHSGPFFQEHHATLDFTINESAELEKIITALEGDDVVNISTTPSQENQED